ncbi:hypothetical protein PC116_g11301 [Phytophthora cactorum]|uniref:Uncharacterized protein n=1 Tax=Phytophthora cactorum TaxID=29920 RepID=A0A329RB18_9STRA|nr:hypothetical protein Pcac1_g12078 [Phytophthora cactorum]KAG2826450.1 hypothetical protein PC113_g21761 [Phytophthora cactorum]KAG3176642.1 hypothetical protein C6341_g8858 [Phytophthora cactorum]KAG4240735.1 hypothetical protein PC116_g11301 [Phytophthora cactorum]RAW21630.1 hypothetical protein PC110_g21925 [Phytophthora cactorum]
MHISYGLEKAWAHGMVVMAATTLMRDSDTDDCGGLSSSGRWKAKLVLFTEKAGVAHMLVPFTEKVGDEILPVAASLVLFAEKAGDEL